MNIRNDSPSFEVVEPPFHRNCGHYHFPYMPCPEGNCGSYLCCRPDTSSSADEREENSGE